jgi:hypothetical protein
LFSCGGVAIADATDQVKNSGIPEIDIAKCNGSLAQFNVRTFLVRPFGVKKKKPQRKKHRQVAPID